MTGLFPASFKIPPKNKLQSLVLRGFGGGLDAITDDISMPPTYLVALTNFRRTSSGSQKLRFGQAWFTDVRDVVTGDIVDQTFFSNSIISVTTTGQIVATNASGVNTVIWNSAIAAALPFPAAGWSATDSVDFVSFRNELIIHNGVDKPVTVSSLLAVSYLADLVGGSNTNTPIGKYGCVVSNFHCVAGIPAAPTVIYISSQGTAGTFPGDLAPNNSLSIDVGAYAPEDAPEIRGIAGFRSNLLVFFTGQALVVTLGEFEAAVHKPRFPDALPTFGLLGHRCIVPIENDLVFAGFDGMGSAKRNLVSGLLDSTYLSDRIAPLYLQRLGQLTDAQILRDTFMVYDKLTHDLTVYTPEGIAFNYSFNEKLRYRAWSEYNTPAWTCGCASPLGRVFLSEGTRIFRTGNTVFAGEARYADKVDDRDRNWFSVTAYAIGDIVRDTVTNESYICIGSNISGAVSFQQDRADQALNPKWQLYDGLAIVFEMELPWISSKDPMKVKFNKYVHIASKGDAEFTLSAHVDNLYKDVNGSVTHTPAVEVEFIGGNAPGFGFDAGPYGGGRRSDDPRLYNFPVKFKTIKPIIVGAAKKSLEIINMSFLYNIGKYRR